MTQAEWLDCSDPRVMLDNCHEGMTDRKLRLFACACCRSVWNDLFYEQSRKGVEIAELWVEQAAGEKDRTEAAYEAEWAWQELDLEEIRPELNCEPLSPHRHKLYAASRAVEFALQPSMKEDPRPKHLVVRWIVEYLPLDERKRVLQDLAVLAHDVFDNPFRLIEGDESWLRWHERTIPKLAQSIYEDRIMPSGELDKTRLAILADALEKAGCSDKKILTHCRGPGPHVRGCFVIDLLLQKS